MPVGGSATACVPHDGRLLRASRTTVGYCVRPARRVAERNDLPVALAEASCPRLRGGYDFPYWFKSLAALGCPAPRVLPALRAATPGWARTGGVRVSIGTPAAEVSFLRGTLQGRFASLRERASPNLDLRRSVRIGDLWAGRRGATTLDQLWTNGAGELAVANGQPPTLADTRQAEIRALGRPSRSGGQGAASSISPARHGESPSPEACSLARDQPSESQRSHLTPAGHPLWVTPTRGVKHGLHVRVQISRGDGRIAMAGDPLQCRRPAGRTRSALCSAEARSIGS